MKNKTKPTLKLHIRFEFAYEIIYFSSLIIIIGLAYLFASNLLTFNWYTVLFALIAIILIYLKYESFLKIENETLSLTYGKFIKKTKIEMSTISEFTFYKQSRTVEIKSNGTVIAQVYLTQKNKEKLLNYIVQYYPNIPCLFIG